MQIKQDYWYSKYNYDRFTKALENNGWIVYRYNLNMSKVHNYILYCYDAILY